MIPFFKRFIRRWHEGLNVGLLFWGGRVVAEKDQRGENVVGKLYQLTVGQEIVAAPSEGWAWLGELSYRIYSKYYFDSLAYAELIAKSARTGKVKLEVEGYDISFCTGAVFFSGVLWLQFEVEGVTLWVAQGNSRIDCLYYPDLCRVYSIFKYYDKGRVSGFRDYLVFSEFKAVKKGARFSGALLGYARPYHYIADHLTSLYEVATRAGDFYFRNVSVYGLGDGVFLHPKYVSEGVRSVRIVSQEDVRLELASDQCMLRLVRGSNQSFDNYNFRESVRVRVLRDAVLRERHCEVLDYIKSNYDFVLWVGNANEKRSWREQDSFVVDFVRWLVEVCSKKVFIFLDGMTASVEKVSSRRLRVDEISCASERYPSLIEGESRVACFNVAGFDSAEKLLYSTLVDYCLTNSLTDSIHVSRLSGVKGLGFRAAGFKSSHIHPDYIFSPECWVRNVGEGDLTRVSFSVSLEKMLALAKQDVFDVNESKLFSKTDGFRSFLRESGEEYAVESASNIRVFLDSSTDLSGLCFKKDICSLVFKGEAEKGVRLLFVVTVRSSEGIESKHRALLGSVVEFSPGDCAEVVSVSIYASGLGRFKFYGIKAICDQPEFSSYL